MTKLTYRGNSYDTDNVSKTLTNPKSHREDLYYRGFRQGNQVNIGVPGAQARHQKLSYRGYVVK